MEDSQLSATVFARDLKVSVMKAGWRLECSLEAVLDKDFGVEVRRAAR